MIRFLTYCSLLIGLVSLGAGSVFAMTEGSFITMGPQAMEGDLRLRPGDTLNAGYSFTLPGKHSAATVSFWAASVTFEARCMSGASAGTVEVFLGGDPVAVLSSSSAWYPTGDQHDAAAYQGSTVVPDLCDGGLIRLRSGGTFGADVRSTDTLDKVNVRWHYSANGTSGSWSGTASVIPGSLDED